MKRNLSHAGDAAASAIPFSRPLPVDRLPPDGEIEVSIEASAAERERLAVLDGLVGIDSLSAHFFIARKGRSGISLKGDVKAEVVQMCILTLEPFSARINEPVDLNFAPPEEVAAAEAALHADPESGDFVETSDPPDPIVNGSIDLGAVAAEFLVLGLDPYPKRPGARFDSGALEDFTASPFTVLERLKRPEN